MECESGLELEHAIGFAGSVPDVLSYQPLTKNKFIYGAGGSVVIADFDDPHDQCFFQGHDSNISCVKLSPSGRMIASGQSGENSDVIVWDYSGKRLIYRFEEHDFGVKSISFSHDERLLVTLGTPEDNKLIVWDLATGKIVASMVPRGKTFNCVLFGGFVKDVKKRNTKFYQLAVAGDSNLEILSLDPFTGQLSSSRVKMGSCVRKFTCINFSRTSDYLYAGSKSGDITVISMKNRNFESSFPVCRVGVTSIATGSNKDGKEMLLVGGGDGSATSWIREIDYYGKGSYVKIGKNVHFHN